MLPDFVPVSSRPAWARLGKACRPFLETPIKELFLADEDRFFRHSYNFPGILFDFSKQRIDRSVVSLLLDLATESGFSLWRDALFSGEPVNQTEGRPAAHWRLRNPAVNPEVAEQLQRVRHIVQRIHAGQWRGVLGDVITDVINLGVGGSELGPLMVSTALEREKARTAKIPRVHFISSLDGGQLERALGQLDPRTTLFLVSSKSFSTIDTLSNAATARQWLEECLGVGPELMRCHFIGISAASARMTEWGLPPENQLLFWDWVGGRFSLWSAIGLPIALTAGFEAFQALLAGGRAMDQHFMEAPLESNIPLIMALVDVWNVNFLGIGTRAVLPYDSRLKGLPVYLEQLEMESNGKSVDLAGNPVDYDTCPVIWGEVGPNAQHAFYQLLHQGTHPVACEFIVSVKGFTAHNGGGAGSSWQRQHKLSLANCLAQSRLLALGETADEGGDSPQYCRGNQPCTSIILQSLDPYTLGALIAAYEHKVFAASVIWGVNPFDQWGVERGKLLAREILPAIGMEKCAAMGLDASTKGLIQFADGASSAMADAVERDLGG